MQDNCNDKSGWVMIVLCLVSALVFVLACFGAWNLGRFHYRSLNATQDNDYIEMYHDQSDGDIVESNIVLEGVGGQYKDDLSFDFESTNDVLRYNSTTGVDKVVEEELTKLEKVVNDYFEAGYKIGWNDALNNENPNTDFDYHLDRLGGG